VLKTALPSNRHCGYSAQTDAKDRVEVLLPLKELAGSRGVWCADAPLILRESVRALWGVGRFGRVGRCGSLDMRCCRAKAPGRGALGTRPLRVGRLLMIDPILVDGFANIPAGEHDREPSPAAVHRARARARARAGALPGAPLASLSPDVGGQPSGALDGWGVYRWTTGEMGLTTVRRPAVDRWPYRRRPNNPVRWRRGALTDVPLVRCFGERHGPVPLFGRRPRLRRHDPRGMRTTGE
jgi:hypothetical protein